MGGENNTRKVGCASLCINESDAPPPDQLRGEENITRDLQRTSRLISLLKPHYFLGEDYGPGRIDILLYFQHSILAADDFETSISLEHWFRYLMTDSLPSLACINQLMLQLVALCRFSVHGSRWS